MCTLAVHLHYPAIFFPVSFLVRDVLIFVFSMQLLYGVATVCSVIAVCENALCRLKYFL